MDIKIIYEDEDILAIDKPAGLVVNRSDTQFGKFTVQDWIEKYISRNVANIRSERGDPILTEEFIDKNGLSHRLDKETSGVMLISKTLLAFGELKNQFKERTVEKEYLVLVHGRIDPLKLNLPKPAPEPKKIARGDERFRYRKTPRRGLPERKVSTISENVHLKTINFQTFEVSGFMGRNRENRMRFSMLASGKESRTIFRVEKYFKNPVSGEALTLLRCFPRSGRTHQIRVHLFAIGHPVLSDETYSGHKQSSRDRKWSPRLFLHAARITINHPRTGAKIRLECDMAEELAWALGKLTPVNTA
ncbi:hypothetical protein COY33_00485 [candidate division WWE3 bacterium CG_4_10_14_0_2_um_filter_42_7]|uniref:Pseudouridine synthase RsuA/RluA-like domain-containing protein n=2 Tax=Katanobacteria TaxID=422282 RepID=A0A2H0X986_UNCKA|nr:MAG: hypothetical protein COT51_02400 [candidate division WWE3 bacterium CG08_land_8_20_14_0_20_41_15]PIZ43973.1 MAG: hypothetical protein COY33_00485 [candidate division WWE3 bacterium CG_4_10_14_0_2_um_filter_42_7]